MTAYNLRPDWRNAFGPLDLKMPNDPSPTMTDFEAALVGYWPAPHEDSEDALNADGTWGPTNPGASGGSGISFGYSSSDLSAVVVADGAVSRRPIRYDYEHWIRQIRYAVAAWEMTHDTKFARRIVAYDTIATGYMTDDPATVHLGDPSWIPDTLAQYRQMAQANPGVGLPWNGRNMGWIAWNRAMRHKVDRKVTVAWATTLIDTCALAARPGTGQLCNWQSGPFNPTLPGETSTFHEAIFIMGVLALCYRLHWSIPYWVFDWMTAIEHAPRTDYYGCQSPVRFWGTVNGYLVPSVRPDQQGDPAFAWWSSLCVALHKMAPTAGWLDKATLIGPTTNVDEQSRKFTMLWRGATA